MQAYENGLDDVVAHTDEHLQRPQRKNQVVNATEPHYEPAKLLA